MTKWFDTNYHYIVPEFSAATEFKLDASRLLEQLAEAKAQGVKAKPVIVGPVTYLWLGKAKDDSEQAGSAAERLLPVYAELLERLAAAGAEWVQIDEPVLVTELDADWTHAFNLAYHHLRSCRVKLLLATYFGALQGNLHLAANLPVAGLHIDTINARAAKCRVCSTCCRRDKVAFAGRHRRPQHLEDRPERGARLAASRCTSACGERLWIAPSCSLLHVPVDLDSEQKLDAEMQVLARLRAAEARRAARAGARR